MNASTEEHVTSLSDEQVEAFGREIDAIRKRVASEVGEPDARYIRGVIRLQRMAEVGGRAFMFAGVLPSAWGAGVALLSLAKILDAMAIGHNVLHGQYDWMHDPAVSSARYAWDIVCPENMWKHSHNYLHHTFTNVVGKDRDVGYGFLRVAEEQPWRPLYLAQPAYALGLMFVFEWGITLHNLELEKVLAGEKSLRAALAESKPIQRKAARQMLKDYVVFPVLAGPFAPWVLAGDVAANVVRNVWAFLIIFCGHFPDGVATYPPGELEGETRAHWYLRQIGGSANIDGSRWFHLLSGDLSHQIEHHLFPDLPANRYAEIAPEVRAVCSKYGVAYTTGSFARQVGSVARRLLRLALPTRGGAAASPAAAWSAWSDRRWTQGLRAHAAAASAVRLGYPLASATYLRVRRDVEDFTHRNRFGVAGRRP
jgi:fatty acid desaturase